MANIINQFGQIKVGFRSAQPIPSSSTVWNNIYSVYNADSVGSSSLKTSLVSVYNGESNANDSYGSNNGTAVGGLTYTTGKIGDAFNFNGTTSYVNMGDVMDVGTSSWSYSFWFKTNDAVNAGICFSKSFSGNASGRFWGGYYNNRFAWNFQADTNVIYTETNNGSIVNNTWYHVVCVLDRNDKLKLYINGSLQTLNVTSGTNNLTPYVSYNFNTNHPFRIGAYTAADNTTANALVNGQVDAFNVWNRVLTQSEITELYNSGNGSQYITDNFYKPTSNDALLVNNGTAQGGLTYGVGKVGTAFQFNGTTAYVEMGDVMDIGTSSWTYSMWFNANNVSGGILFAKVRLAGVSGRVWAGFNGGKLYFGFDKSNGISTVIETTTTYSTNTWYNFTCVLDRSSNLKMYVNGSLASYTSTQDTNDMTPYISTNYNNNTPFRLGCFTQSDNVTAYGFYNGKLDGFNVWNRVLTPTEITELYNSGNGIQYTSQLVPLLLDTYTGAAAAYSLRKLRAAYTGNAITVRRSSDNTSQNIGFDSNGNLDTTSLLSFVGAGNGFVSTWFDQGGGGKDAIQATAANQPQIVSNGNMITLNNKPSLSFNGSTFMNTTQNVLSVGNGGYSVFGLGKPQGTPNCLFYIGSSTLNNGVGLNNNNGTPRHYWFANDYDSNQTFVNTNSIFTVSFDGVKRYTTINNVNTSSNSSGKNTTNPTLSIGRLPGYGQNLVGYESELIIYDSNKESIRTNITNDMNTFYTIY